MQVDDAAYESALTVSQWEAYQTALHSGCFRPEENDGFDRLADNHIGHSMKVAKTSLSPAPAPGPGPDPESAPGRVLICALVAAGHHAGPLREGAEGGGAALPILQPGPRPALLLHVRPQRMAPRWIILLRLWASLRLGAEHL